MVLSQSPGRGASVARRPEQSEEAKGSWCPSISRDGASANPCLSHQQSDQRPPTLSTPLPLTPYALQPPLPSPQPGPAISEARSHWPIGTKLRSREVSENRLSYGKPLSSGQPQGPQQSRQPDSPCCEHVGPRPTPTQLCGLAPAQTDGRCRGHGAPVLSEMRTWALWS